MFDLPIIQKFWSRVQKRPDSCWIFGKADRYGQIDTGAGKFIGAHRFSYMLAKGPIGRGMYICHTCDTPGCVNPLHLYEGTHEDNTRDIVARGRKLNGLARARRVRREAGYRLGRSLTEAQRQQVIVDYASGQFTQTALATKYEASQATISAVVRNVHNMGAGINPRRRSGNFRRKVDESQRDEIRRLYATGKFKQAELADRFGCDQTSISKYVLNS